MACAHGHKLPCNRTSKHHTLSLKPQAWPVKKICYPSECGGQLSYKVAGVKGRRSVATSASPGVDPGSGSAVPGPSEVIRKLARQYYFVQNPALANQLYSKAVEEFTESAVIAYECGHNEQDVDEQLGQLSEDDLKQLKGFDADECLAMVCLVWITLMLSPRSVKRWAKSAAVSEATLTQWRGFVAMIVNGYFERRMAWFPLDRLQLELSAVQGRSLPPELVAERARVVYTTLEQVYPQFAKD
ncbi:hypothetical protein PLESTF_000285900 [Pleodorina starrii]|nr:hypothetical protein PLESTF_000285900 [Pleodorina starrii]